MLPEADGDRLYYLLRRGAQKHRRQESGCYVRRGQPHGGQRVAQPSSAYEIRVRGEVAAH